MFHLKFLVDAPSRHFFFFFFVCTLFNLALWRRLYRTTDAFAPPPLTRVNHHVRSYCRWEILFLSRIYSMYLIDSPLREMGDGMVRRRVPSCNFLSLATLYNFFISPPFCFFSSLSAPDFAKHLRLCWYMDSVYWTSDDYRSFVRNLITEENLLHTNKSIFFFFFFFVYWELNHRRKVKMRSMD